MPRGAQPDRADERQHARREREAGHRRRPPGRAARRRARSPTSVQPATTATAIARRSVVDRAAWRNVSIQPNASAVETARAIASPSRPAIAWPANASGTWTASTPSADEREPSAAAGDEDERERDGQRDRGDHVRGHRDDEPADLGPDVVAVRTPEHAAGDLGACDGEDPAVAATTRRAGQDDASTCRATRCGSRPSRVSGTAVTSPIEEALMPTTAAAIRYAYPKLVTEPTPSRAAMGRHTR